MGIWSRIKNTFFGVVKKDSEGYWHHPPCYYGYRGGYDTVTICTDCKMIGLYEDCHPASPCYDCGGKVKDGHSGKYDYNTGFWVLREPKTTIVPTDPKSPDIDQKEDISWHKQKI